VLAEHHLSRRERLHHALHPHPGLLVLVVAIRTTTTP
jgi:hypothetical protein